MISKFGKFFLLVSILMLLIPAVSFAAPPYLPIVPCGLNSQPAGISKTGPDGHDYTQSCNACELFHLAKNVIDFIILGVVPVLGTFLFIVGGLLILLSGASEKLYSAGRSIFWNTFVSIAIIFGAWLITNTVIRSLAGDNNIAREWWKFECVVPAPFVPEIPPPGILPTTAGLRDSANQLINKIGINNFSSNATCGGNNHARQNIQDISAGRVPSVCSNSCPRDGSGCRPGGSSGSITVDKKILDGLIGLSNRGINFVVTSLTTGSHKTSSKHYTGRAVDIAVSPESPLVWIEARTYLNSLGGSAICEDQNGRDVASCSPIPSVVDHIHWEI